MEVEEFEIDYSHKGSPCSIFVKRFLIQEEVHLWTLVSHPRAPAQIFTYYETDSPDILYWRPMNDKRDELMKIIGKPLLKKIAELKKKGKIQIYEFNE